MILYQLNFDINFSNNHFLNIMIKFFTSFYNHIFITYRIMYIWLAIIYIKFITTGTYMYMSYNNLYMVTTNTKHANCITFIYKIRFTYAI